MLLHLCGMRAFIQVVYNFEEWLQYFLSTFLLICICMNSVTIFTSIIATLLRPKGVHGEIKPKYIHVVCSILNLV